MCPASVALALVVYAFMNIGKFPRGNRKRPFPAEWIGQRKKEFRHHIYIYVLEVSAGYLALVNHVAAENRVMTVYGVRQTLSILKQGRVNHV